MYTVKVTCRKCGRDSKFDSTDKVRECPLCAAESRRSYVEGLLPKQFKRPARKVRWYPASLIGGV